MKRLSFSEIWATDFEYGSGEGERPSPRCMVARELRSSRTIRLWADELRALPGAPFPVGPSALFVAYTATAELGCFQVLGWPMPENILDLFAEFRWWTSGLRAPCGHGLLGALAYFGIPGVDAKEKDTMRDLALRGGEYTADEKRALITYCETDVNALELLLPAMIDGLDLPRALLRGRYMKALARIEHRGTPIDVPTLAKLRANWETIQASLIDRIDPMFQVYEGRTFKMDRFERYLSEHGIPWPRTETGRLSLEEDTFMDMVKAHPALAPLQELRHSLSELRLNKLAVGADGRNRVMLGAFGSVTGRNQPSNAKFVFGPSCWVRGLIKPEPGMAIAYVDFSAAEFGIAAYLSGDENMIAAYKSGDPYLTFAKQAGAVPQEATKKSHPAERSRFKICALGVQYGMAGTTLGLLIGKSPAHGQELVDLHRRTYPKFWRWSQAAVDHAMINGHLEAAFGWRIQVDRRTRLLTLRNFLVQAGCAEVLRIAAILATEAGVRVCAPIHDAFLIEAPIQGISGEVERCQMAMNQASLAVLGYPLRSDYKIFLNRYMDEERGRVMWDVVMGILSTLPPTSI